MLGTTKVTAYDPGEIRATDDALPPLVQGALVSLVYNRGTSMVDKPGDDRRKEMPTWNEAG